VNVAKSYKVGEIAESIFSGRASEGARQALVNAANLLAKAGQVDLSQRALELARDLMDRRIVFVKGLIQGSQDRGE
jgi:anthranilate phosphoribosyltransferase